MVQEFKDFVNRGNLVDIAVAFVMGAAFSSVVNALTERIVAPLIGLVFTLDGLGEFGTFTDTLAEDGYPVGSVGVFIAAVLNFLIVAAVMFVVVRAYNRMKNAYDDPADEQAPQPSDEVKLLTEIRDSLVK